MPGIHDVNLVTPIQRAKADRQGGGRAAPARPKSRPQVHLPVQSVPLLRPKWLPAARTARKTHRFLNGGRVAQNGQAGAAIGCSVSASVSSHWTPSGCTHCISPLLSTVSDPNSAGFSGKVVNNRVLLYEQGDPYKSTRFREEHEPDGLGRKTIKNRR